MSDEIWKRVDFIQSHDACLSGLESAKVEIKDNIGNLSLPILTDLTSDGNAVSFLLTFTHSHHGSGNIEELRGTLHN